MRQVRIIDCDVVTLPDRRGRDGRAILTPREAAVYAVIRTRILGTGLAPALKEIAESVGLDSHRQAAQYVYALTRKGYVRRAKWKHRSIMLVEPEMAVADA